mgnify:CR=1 FL=1
MRYNLITIFGGVLLVFWAISGVVEAQLKITKPLQQPPSPHVHSSAVLATAIFEDDESIGEWYMNSNSGTLERRLTGGLPGGFLHMKGFKPYIIGMRTRRPEFTGKYLRPGAVSFDLKYKIQQITNYKVYVMLVNCSAIIGSNWIFELQIPGDYTWEHVSVLFDPSWTDQQAIAAGWKRQTESPPVSWAQTLYHLRWIGIYVETFSPTAYLCEIGTDNFLVQR